MSKPKVKVTVQRDGFRPGSSTKIVEFMVTGGHVKDGSQGGLISIAIDDDGIVWIEPYRLDAGVRIISPAFTRKKNG